jgi:hypothetical protein
MLSHPYGNSALRWYIYRFRSIALLRGCIPPFRCTCREAQCQRRIGLKGRSRYCRTCCEKKHCCSRTGLPRYTKSFSNWFLLCCLRRISALPWKIAYCRSSLASADCSLYRCIWREQPRRFRRFGLRECTPCHRIYRKCRRHSRIYWQG